MRLSQVKTAQYSVCESKSKFIFFSIDAEDETNNFAIEAITLPAGYSIVLLLYTVMPVIFSLFSPLTIAVAVLVIITCALVIVILLIIVKQKMVTTKRHAGEIPSKYVHAHVY